MNKKIADTKEIVKYGYMYTLRKLDTISLHLRDMEGRFPCFMGNDGFVLCSVVKLKQ